MKIAFKSCSRQTLLKQKYNQAESITFIIEPSNKIHNLHKMLLGHFNIRSCQKCRHLGNQLAKLIKWLPGGYWYNHCIM